MNQENPAHISSQWDEEKGIFTSTISGHFDFAAVKAWQEDILSASQQIPENCHFAFLLDERKYQYTDPEVHKIKRDVVPRFLAKFGLLLSVLPDEQKQILTNNTKLDSKRRICVKQAMVHSNVDAMTDLQNQFGNEQQYYGSELSDAIKWLQK